MPARRILFVWCFSAGLLCLDASVLLAEELVSYNREIRPLLSNKCFRCHGPDRETREAGLRLDRRDAATAELDSGDQAIVPGNPERSQLLERLHTDDEDLRMPPADIGPPLNESEIALLRRWIHEGAAYEKHWSLETIRHPMLPDLQTNVAPDDSGNAVDRFIDRQLAVQQLVANPPADRPTLIRRVTLALTGLPPTPDELTAFERTSSPQAYSQLVERLLASPRFGERWARVWLDIARYADSAGYAQDPARSIWRYRDWVIEAYNNSKSFDQFTIEQIAGDLLDTPSSTQLLATAFHRNTMTNSEGGTDDEEFRNAAVVDRVNTTMQVWMGLTMGCAQCHDHKYDDISQEDYFRFFAILNNTQDADRPDERPWMEEFSESQQTRREALLQELDVLKAEGTEKRREELKQEIAAIRGIRTPVMRERSANQQRETFVHVRGSFRTKGKQVQPGTPAALHPLAGEANRLGMAEWLIAQENPLTARVLVNRYWELLFGTGLVTTSEDFGMQGDLPTHPELLDYLAAEMMRRGWDTKWLLKEIVSSNAYRRTSKVTTELAQRDGSNQWLARGPRFRLPAEMIRDQALAVSGLLSAKMYGPSVQPPRPKLGLRAAFGGSTDWETSTGEDRYRRGLYTSWRRTTPYPSMTTFDAPSREFCTVRRIRTNTPLQALVTMNDPVFIEAAQALARRVTADRDDWDARIQRLFELVLARPARPFESSKLKRLYDETLTGFQVDRNAAMKLALQPRERASGDAERDVAALATWTVLSNVMLNLDETLAPR